VFTGQAVQVEFDVDPLVAEYVFTPQSRHTEAPVTVEYLPAPQSVHAVEPVVVLYFPAAQPEHVPPSGPVNPALQTQLLNSAEPLRDCVLGGQARQVLSAVAPVVNEYLLIPHFKQELADVAPVVVEYFPEMH
jgi:hypothetical protein